MHTAAEQQITVAEERLRLAMLNSDIAALDELISSDLIFTNHLGQVLGKQDDLELHRSGVLRFHTIEPSERQVKASGQFAVVSGCPAPTVARHLRVTFGTRAYGVFRRATFGKSWRVISAPYSDRRTRLRWVEFLESVQDRCERLSAGVERSGGTGVYT